MHEIGGIRPLSALVKSNKAITYYASMHVLQDPTSVFTIVRMSKSIEVSNTTSLPLDTACKQRSNELEIRDCQKKRWCSFVE